MQAKRLDAPAKDTGLATWALIFEPGDEVAETLKRFAVDNNLDAAHFTAIGAFERATLAYFDWESKQYADIAIDEQVEVLSFLGDIARGDDGAPAVHAHVVVGKRDGTAHGGHLKKAWVRPTLEVVLTESPRHLRRTERPELGLALIDLSAETQNR